MPPRELIDFRQRLPLRAPARSVQEQSLDLIHEGAEELEAPTPSAVLVFASSTLLAPPEARGRNARAAAPPQRCAAVPSFPASRQNADFRK